MIILTIRTDNPEAEVGLFDGNSQLAYETWHAHRDLSVQLHRKIEDVISSCGMQTDAIQGIACFEGPGSFTGLRIGLTVGNALAYSLRVPVVAAGGEDWIATATSRLLNSENDNIVLPEYGAPVHITKQKK